jgi:hypothetical protein
MKEQTDFKTASKKREILLITKNYIVFIEYKILYKKEKTEQETLVKNYIYSHLN